MLAPRLLQTLHINGPLKRHVTKFVNSQIGPRCMVACQK